MVFWLSFDLIFLLFIVGFTVVSDSGWSLSDEPLATHNTGFLSDGELLAFNQPDLITNDIPFSPQDEFSPLYGNAENDNIFSSGDDVVAGESTI